MKLPDFKKFTQPFGSWTNTNYSGPAVTAYGDMVGTLASAAAQQASAEAQADASKYGSFANSNANLYNGFAGGMSSLYGGLGSTLGSLAGSNAGIFGTLGGGLSSLGSSRASVDAARSGALSNLGVGAGASAANAFGSLSSGLTGLANAQASETNSLANARATQDAAVAQALANAYGGYSTSVGNIAAARANEAAARYSSNAMAEAARQASLGNIGSSALGAYGSALGSALGSWGQAESAYQNAMGNVGAANQASIGNVGSAAQAANANIGAANAQAAGGVAQSRNASLGQIANAVSQLGQSRNSALANLGGSYAQAGAGLTPAAVAGDLDLSFEDFGSSGTGGSGGFSASGVDGPIASGSFGEFGLGGSNGMRLTASRSNDNSGAGELVGRSFGGLDALSSRLDNQYAYSPLAGITGLVASGGFDGGAGEAYDQVNRSSADSYAALAAGLANSQPSRPDYGFITQTLGQGGGMLANLAAGAYGSAGSGMDQFYSSQPNASDYSSYLSALDSQLAESNAGISSSRGDLPSQSDFSGLQADMMRGFGSTSGQIGGLANRAFTGLDERRYSDSDLVGSLLAGYGSSMRNNSGLARQAVTEYGNAASALSGELDSSAQRIGSQYSGGRRGSPSIASTLLSNMGTAKQPTSSYLKTLQAEYDSLTSGDPYRFNYSPITGTGDLDAINKKSYLAKAIQGERRRLNALNS